MQSKFSTVLVTAMASPTSFMVSPTSGVVSTMTGTAPSASSFITITTNAFGAAITFKAATTRVFDVATSSIASSAASSMPAAAFTEEDASFLEAATGDVLDHEKELDSLGKDLDALYETDEVYNEFVEAWKLKDAFDSTVEGGKQVIELGKDAYEVGKMILEVEKSAKAAGKGMKAVLDAENKLGKLMDIHMPIPRRILTHGSRGMDVVVKSLELMIGAVEHSTNRLTFHPDNAVVTRNIGVFLGGVFQKPMGILIRIMKFTDFAVEQVNLKIQPTCFHKDPEEDEAKGAYGVLVRAYKVLETGNAFAAVAAEVPGFEWMPAAVEPIMIFARAIAVQLDACVDNYPPLPPPPAADPVPKVPSLKDLVEEVEEVSKIWEEGEKKVEESVDGVEDEIYRIEDHFGHHNGTPSDHASLPDYDTPEIDHDVEPSHPKDPKIHLGHDDGFD
ncbi:hypothetical protein SBRCBS47491_009729 [Sporothrix bragantina]|uniref:Uncharacterized protein n=1 Tax=Sporothrix bragantina TaxID=671064 RepID=A0ABP0D0B4_9PEZI